MEEKPTASRFIACGDMKVYRGKEPGNDYPGWWRSLEVKSERL
jgi:hypothetical protein